MLTAKQLVIPCILALTVICYVTSNVLRWGDKSIAPFLFKQVLTSNKPAYDNITNSNANRLKKSEMILSRCGDDDCIQLRNRLKKWPEGKPKAFVYYLIQPDRIYKLSESLRSMETHFNDVYHYPVIIFHENISAISLNLIRSSSKSDIYFQTVRFEIPDFLPRNLTQRSGNSRIGYRHMCRFHAKLIYEEPIIHGFDYAWRLDDDSKILRPIKYDIFEYMRKRHLKYGYVHAVLDDLFFTVNLWESARDYINNVSITPYFFNNWPKNQVYYNNFEVSRLSLWLSDDYQKFFDYIDRLGGIYYYRWGDAPIKTIAVSIFVQQNETFHFKDIGYQHQSLIIA